MNKKRKFALLALVACISFSLFGCAQRNEKKEVKEKNKITYNEVKDLSKIKNTAWVTLRVKVTNKEIKDFTKVKWNASKRYGLFIGKDNLCIAALSRTNKTLYGRYFNIKKDKNNKYDLNQFMLVDSSNRLKKKKVDLNTLEKIDRKTVQFASNKLNYYKTEDKNKKADLKNVKFYISSNKRVVITEIKLKNNKFKYTRYVKK